MRKSLIVQLLAVLLSMGAAAQGALSPQRGVMPYYSDAELLKLSYRDTPYYLPLSGSWYQRETDTTVRYVRQIEVEETWQGFQVYLCLRGTYGVRLYLNGNEVGEADDSRQWHYFNITPHLHYGKPLNITIDVLKAPRGSLLEAPHQAVGLTAEPYLLFKSTPNICDYTLQASYDAATSSGTLSLNVDLSASRKRGKFYIEADVLDEQGHSIGRMGKWVVLKGKETASVEMARTWTTVAPWSAEFPTLYTLALRLRNADMEEMELVGTRFGFRTVEVKDGQLLLCGRPLLIKGVTYGLSSDATPEARQAMEADLMEMKAQNINAVRTVETSPMDASFYELCDRIGLYVICDANLMPRSDRRHAVATDPDYAPLFEKRVDNLYGALKNHTSIIAWNLGEGSDNGLCMAAAYRRLKLHDSSRPVLCAAAESGEGTDIVALLRPEAAPTRQLLGRLSDRPALLLQATDSTHFANLLPLWEMVSTYRPLQGGFASRWPMNDVQLEDLKTLYRPFDIQLVSEGTDEQEYIVHNRYTFTSFGNYTLDYNIFTNLRSSITGGDLPVVVPGGGSDKFSLRVPPLHLQAGEEAFVRFELRERIVRHSHTQMRSVGSQTFPLREKAVSSTPIAHKGSRLQADTLSPMPYPIRFEGHADWPNTETSYSHYMADSLTFVRDRILHYTDASGRSMADVRQTLTYYSSGDIIADYTIAPASTNIKGLIPTVSLPLPQGAEQLRWFGNDRQTSFTQGSNTQVGTYTASLTDLSEGATRAEVRWGEVSSNTEALYFAAVDHHSTIELRSGSLTVRPEAVGESFRLHLHPIGEQSPSAEQLYALRFPTVQTGILPTPTITAAEGRFSEPLQVVITASQDGIIRYTLDGTDPTEQSPIYSKPLQISATTVVKARLFAKGMPPSFCAMRRFNYDHIVRIIFSRPPSAPYNAGADTLLFDGQQASADDLQRGWIGFAGAGTEISVGLAKEISVSEIKLRFAHAPNTWAFAPRSVKIIYGTDASTMADTTITLDFDPADQANQSPRVVEISVPMQGRGLSTFVIAPDCLTTIPAWHRGKGLKPWLMMDEIEVIEN